MAISTNPSTDPVRAGASLDRRGRASGPGLVPETGAAIQVSHLRKTYGPVVAVDDVSFSVAEGEVFGILGPNGAGKTTTVECVIGLRCPDAGAIRVMGLDPQVDREELHIRHTLSRAFASAADRRAPTAPAAHGGPGSESTA